MKYKEVRDIMMSLYENGKTYTAKEKQAIYDHYLCELRKLAYRNHAEAQYSLAQHYEDIGYWGVPNPFYNPKKMFYWYSKSVANEYTYAYNALAYSYELGIACNQDIDKALELYETGMRKGDVLAKKNYKLLKKQIKNGTVYKVNKE